jgi:hypothetical protein
MINKCFIETSGFQCGVWSVKSGVTEKLHTPLSTLHTVKEEVRCKRKFLKDNAWAAGNAEPSGN